MSPHTLLSKLVRDKEIKREHIFIFEAFVRRCSLQSSGQWTLSFPSEKTIAEECDCDVKTVQRAVKSMRETSLVNVYAARMRDGKYAQNVYDCTPWFRACGAQAKEHNMDTVQQHLGKDGRWVRGLQRLDAAGNVVQWADFDNNKRGGATPVSSSAADGLGGIYSETGLDQPRTGGLKRGTNLIPPPVVDFVNDNKSNPRPRLSSLGDDLTGVEQVVFVVLKDLGYGAYKAVSDLKKYGANYVQRVIDYVKAQKDVRSIAKLINHIMGKDLQELYRPSKCGNQKPAPAPPVRPPAASAPSPAPALPPKPILSVKTVVEQADEYRSKIMSYTESQILRALNNAQQEAAKEQKKHFDAKNGAVALLENMKLHHLQFVLYHVTAVANSDNARKNVNKSDDLEERREFDSEDAAEFE